MKQVPFNELNDTDLYINAIYEGGNAGNAGDDPISKLIKGAGNMSGFRYSGNSDTQNFIVLYTSGEDQDWPDEFDLNHGKFIYYGDNKTPDNDLHETSRKGNVILRNLFDRLHTDDAPRTNIPPIFVFEKYPTANSSRSVRFKGLAVPGYLDMDSTEDLVAIWKTIDGRRYQNYEATFTILDVQTIPRIWLDEIMDGNPLGSYVPKMWKDWCEQGIYTPMKTDDDAIRQIDDSSKGVKMSEITENINVAGMTSNAWLAVGENDRFSVTMYDNGDSSDAMEEGDAIVVLAREGERHRIVRIGRLYRKRTRFDTKLYFDGIHVPTTSMILEDMGFVHPSGDSVSRLSWKDFERLLAGLYAPLWNDFPTLEEKDRHAQAHVRELFEDAVIGDLLGPAVGPEEEIYGMDVLSRYLVGKIAPRVSSDGTAYAESGLVEDEEDGAIPSDLKPKVNDDHVKLDDVPVSSEDDSEEEETTNNRSLAPSSLGFTFCIDADTEKLRLDVSWGRYERRTDLDITREKEIVDKRTGETKIKIETSRCWKRIPSGGLVDIDIRERNIDHIVIDPNCSGVLIKGSVGDTLENGTKLVTLFLLNDQTEPSTNRDEAWVFQPRISVRDIDGEAIFRRRPFSDKYGMDEEREALEMIYRNHVEFAVGHGVSTHWKLSSDDAESAVEVSTTIIPEYEIPVTETPGLNPEDREEMRKLVDEGYLDMIRLAEIDRSELVEVLGILVEDYAAWILDQRSRIGVDVVGFDTAADAAMKRCESVLFRLREGVETLEKDDSAFEAFRFANLAMADQRVRSIYASIRRRDEETKVKLSDLYDDPKNHSWRPFQLAFMLLSIPSLANPLHDDRVDGFDANADLLWFPTGGGKTEAYLGVAAFAMGIRRLQSFEGYDSTRGLSVIMRYTLRLLTLQQFQRGSTLICAMEAIRRNSPEKWGETPFTLGLWVGKKVAPNDTLEAHEAIRKARNNSYHDGGSPHQLTSCPWCGAKIKESRDIEVDKFRAGTGRTKIFCSDYKHCDFNETNSPDMGLPVVVVDDELYRRPPSMLIATVDKFAMMGWRGQVRNLFGRANQECPRHGLMWQLDGTPRPEYECNGNHKTYSGLPSTTVKNIMPIRPPDLIIQDEFHLISGPLGTMVGLYETAVDELCSWKIGDKKIHPKIVASTATVRKAKEQVSGVFLRKVAVFPPHGLDVEDNFFSVQRKIDDVPGRRYVGICSPGSSRPAMLIRTYVALLTAAQTLFQKFGTMADPYMTVVGYFNSLRELGGMRRLAEDDVQTRSYRVLMGDVERPGLSQRSVRYIDELTSRVSSKDIPKKLDQLERRFEEETKGTDVVLATNMLSVGVDVNRLGVMAVNGQPKNTAEYIQATSRVGRQYPGIVFTVLTWARPRDLSHYESFEHYHATFYKHVEAQSVTPFAPRALDRGLTGTMISILRSNDNDLNPNTGADKFVDPMRPSIDVTERTLVDRSHLVSDRKDIADLTQEMFRDRKDLWLREAGRPGRTLVYETRSGSGDTVALLRKPGVKAWDERTVPMSMREVEPNVLLSMDESIQDNQPSWKPQNREEEEETR